MKNRQTINCDQCKGFVSIIISIYNSEKYLRKCIESVTNQSYRNIEIILINDGSTDSSLDICNKYQKLDNRIIVIDKNNGGAAQARNRGIEIARGDYIGFVDSDDYIDIDFISQLFDNIVKYKADISACNYFSIYEDRAPMTLSKPRFIEFDNINAVKDILRDYSVMEVILWNKLFKRDLFIKYNIRLPEGDIYEDTRTMYKLLYHSNNTVFTNKPLYYYLQRSNSVMNHKANIKNLLTQLQIPIETEKWLKERGLSIDLELKAHIVIGQINAISYMADNEELYNQMWPEISNSIKNEFKSIIRNPYISKKRKNTCIIIMMGKNYYKIARKTYKKISQYNQKVMKNDKDK